jgi:capsular polysaccharide biosynthesis protein
VTAPASPSSHLWSALRRFWWVVLVLTLLTANAADKSEALAPGTEYTAAGQLIVPVRGPVVDKNAPPSPLPSGPDSAERLARTYAVILESDRALLTAVATAAGVPVDDAEGDITADTVPSTSVVDVSFTANDEALVQSYFAGLVNALATGATPNIPIGNLIVLQDAQVTAEAGLGIPPRYIGLAAGLLLGLAVALLMDRLDARVRTSTDVRRLTDLPVIDLTRRQGPVADDVLAMRVRRLSSDIDEVAVVATDRVSARVTGDVADRLRAADERLSAFVRYEPLAPRAVWTPSGVLADGTEAELAVQRAEATVVVVTVRSRMRAAERAVERLRLLDLSAVVIALVRPPSRWSRLRDTTPQREEPLPVSPEALDTPVERANTPDLAGRP